MVPVLCRSASCMHPRQIDRMQAQFVARLGGLNVSISRVFFAGCFAALAIVAAPNTTTSVTFNKDVLPILQKNCQSCHRPGEVAPMSLMSYSDARPWAKAIKAAVVSQKMPPWFAD